MNFLYNRNSKSGFSSIEVLVSMFIIILIGLVVYSFQKDVFSLNRIISGSLTAQNEALRTLKSISAEIRAVSPSSIGDYAIAQTATSSFTFYSNTDSDSLKERVRYFIDGAILKKGVTKPSGSPLVYNLADEVISELIQYIVSSSTPTFSYYDTNYDGTTASLIEPFDISVVRLVKITIIIDKDPSAPPAPITLTTQISMRNLKDNL